MSCSDRFPLKPTRENKQTNSLKQMEASMWGDQRTPNQCCLLSFRNGTRSTVYSHTLTTATIPNIITKKQEGLSKIDTQPATPIIPNRNEHPALIVFVRCLHALIGSRMSNQQTSKKSSKKGVCAIHVCGWKWWKGMTATISSNLNAMVSSLLLVW